MKTIENITLADPTCPHCRKALRALAKLAKPSKSLSGGLEMTVTADHNAFGNFMGFHLTLNGITHPGNPKNSQRVATLNA